MKEVKLELEFHLDDANEITNEIYEFMNGEISNCELNIKEIPAKTGSMAFSEYLPIIEVVLGSGAVVAGVKGMFGLIKHFAELNYRKFSDKLNADTKQREIEISLQKFLIETEAGKSKVTYTHEDKEIFSIHLHSEDERKIILEALKRD